MLDIFEAVEDWIAANKTIALATVVRTWGSGPRQVGAKMAVTDAGEMAGSVSGGCVESSVVESALAGLESGEANLLHFGVSNEDAWEVGLTCGGQISVFVEPLGRDWWSLLAEEYRSHRRSATATVVKGQAVGRKVIVDADVGEISDGHGSHEEIRSILVEAARDSLEAGESNFFREQGREIFVDLHLPRPRMIVVGGAHVAQTLQELAIRLGFRVILIDPRQTYATPERFPHVEAIHHDYPDQVLPRLGLDSDAYVVVLTHDPKIDDPTLLHALTGPAPYIGVLSSKKSHRQRIRRLRSAGLEAKLLERIRVPIGVDISAKNPQEIALAIMAEIVSVRNGTGKLPENPRNAAENREDESAATESLES